MSNRAMFEELHRWVALLLRFCACACVFLLSSGVVLAEQNPRGRTQTGEVGDALQYALPATVLASSLVKKDWVGARQFSYGLTTVVASTHALKSAVSKERPDRRDDESFPSGHTAVSFHAAAYVHERYGLKWALPAYVVAGYVGHTRIYDDRHDEVDVLAGALLGVVAARFFTTTITTRIGEVQVQPSLGDGFAAVTFSYTP